VSSFVIIRKETGEVICETCSQKVIASFNFNPEKVDIVPIHEYLANLNRKIREGVQS